MKKLSFILILPALFFVSCNLFEDAESVEGAQSPMGDIGETLSASDLHGVQGPIATVTSLSDGISSFSGQVTVTNPAILNILSNMPEFTVDGNTVIASDIKFRITREGVESKVPNYPGTIFKYDSKVGDTYSAGSGYKRKVISKSTEDDYPYGFYFIKVMKVEESPCAIQGVKKMVYIANHRFGLVGVEITLDDNNEMDFRMYSSTEND